MRIKFKGSFVTSDVYHILVLCRLLDIIKLQFNQRLSAVPLQNRNMDTFASLAYEKDVRCMKACFNAAKKYPDLYLVAMRFAYPYAKDIQQLWGDDAANDPSFSVKNA